MSNSLEASIMIDYITIDKPEHMLFQTNEIDYLFDINEKVFMEDITDDIKIINLYYNKPVKEILIVFTKKGTDDDIFTFYPIDNLEISLNNIELTDKRNIDSSYFRVIQPYFHNRKTVKLNLNKTNTIYMYSFATDPDSVKPTGAFNFGNIKNKQLKVEGGKGYTINIYAITNNVLKINGGKSSIQFI